MKLCSWLGPCDPSIHNEPSPLTFGLNHSSVFKHSSSCCCRTEDICMTSSVSQHCDIRLAICSYSRTCCSWGEIWYAHKSTSKWYKRVLSVSFIQRRMHCKKRQLIVNSACFYCEQINAKSTHWMLSVCIPWSHVETAIIKKTQSVIVDRGLCCSVYLRIKDLNVPGWDLVLCFSAVKLRQTGRRKPSLSTETTRK